MSVRKLRAITIAAALLGLTPASSGCAGAIARAAENAVGATNVHKYINAKATGDYGTAVAVMRAEIKQPLSNDPEYLANVHTLAIEGLSLWAEANGFDANLDAEAQGYYQSGMGYAGQNALIQSQLQWMMALYYSRTHRNRSGLDHMRAVLAYARQAGSAFDNAKAHDGLASMFSDMGELELSAEHRAQALRHAEGHFVSGAPLSTGEWLLYVKVLQDDMEGRRRGGAPASELVGHWEKIRNIVDVEIAEDPLAQFHAIGAYLVNSQTFALAGDGARARELFEEARRRADEVKIAEARGSLAVGLDCSAAAIEALVGDVNQAATMLTRCEEGRRKQGLERPDAGLAEVAGNIHEGRGDLAAAAERYTESTRIHEEIRRAIPVEERAPFFRGLARKPWWGLIRVRAKQFMQTGSESDLVLALQASDGLRARQLTELTGAPSTGADLSLAQLRARLGPGGALVSYVTTEREVIVIVVTATTARASVVPAPAHALEARLNAVTAGMEKSGPGYATLASEVSALGQTLVAPISAELASATRITVIGDGAINAFPYELLELAPGQPLGQRATVASTPSLEFFLRQSPTKPAHSARLYAVGDPQYGAPPAQIGYLQSSEITDGSRGSRFLAYFTPLPETRSEVAAISKLFPQAADLKLGSDATESQFKQLPPTHHTYVHFATHGILAGQVPGLAEPALVLGNEASEDGFLTASEVAQMRLDADLTVLSACSTGDGESLPGEGVMGMGRAFLVAGSRGTIVSLWPVDSAATEALMVAFYEHHRSGLDAGRALREAKADIRRDPRWSHPFYWSAFILVAEGGLLRDTGTVVARGDRRRAGSGDRGASKRGLELRPDPAPAPSPSPNPSQPSAPGPGAFANDYSIQRPFD